MKLIDTLKKYRRLFLWAEKAFPSPADLGSCGKNAFLEQPLYFDCPSSIHLAENARIRRNTTIISAPTEKVVIKKYTVIAPNSTIITNSHRKTATLPQFLLGVSHINDKSKDVVIGEDVWVGSNSTILAGVTVGRGSIVAACALVTKDVPPYTLVVGSPARVVAQIFSVEDILRHEQEIYPPEERLPEAFLRKLFEEEYKGLKVFGCSTPLTDEEKARVEKIKQDSHFIDWK